MGHPHEIFAKASANAAKALKLDETISSAHNALAAIHIIHNWDWAAAEAESRRAVELSPADPVTHAHLADYLSIRGRHGEAIEAFRRALDLDPISREYTTWLALILYRARRYDESIAHSRKVLELDSHYANALWFLALSLEQMGDLPETIATLERAVAISIGPHYKSLLGRACALAGDRSRALNILDQLKELSQRRYVSPFDIAVVYFGLGELTPTFQWLEEAYQQRVWRILELTTPMFDSLRSDPRCQDLVRRIGLAQ